MSNEDLVETTEKQLERARAILDGPDTEEKQVLLAILSKPAKKDAVATEPDSPIPPAGPEKEIRTVVATASTDALKPRTTIMGRDFEEARWGTEGDYKGQPWLAPVGNYKPGFQQDVMVRDPKLNKQITDIIKKGAMRIDDPLAFSIEIDGTRFDLEAKTWHNSDLSLAFLNIYITFTDPKDKQRYSALLSLSPTTEKGTLTYADKIPGYKDGDYCNITGWTVRRMRTDGSNRFAVGNEYQPSKATTPERIKLLEGIKIDELLAEIEQRMNG